MAFWQLQNQSKIISKLKEKLKDLALLSDQIAAILRTLVETKRITVGQLVAVLYCSERTAYNYYDGSSRLRADQFIVIALWLYSIGECEMLELILPENRTLTDMSGIEVNGSLDDEMIDATHAISSAGQAYEAGRFEEVIEEGNNLKKIGERIIKEGLQKKK